MRTINPPKTRLVRVAVGRFENGEPVALVSFVVPADLSTEAILDRAYTKVRRDLGVPGMALRGTVAGS